jgi:hypothetical protein
MKRWLLFTAGMLVSSAAVEVSAQQTIINVPSDALTPRGQGFYLHESQAAPWTDKADFNTTNFLCYGLTDHTELCLTQYGVDNRGSHGGAVGMGFKSVYDLFEDRWPEWEVKGTYGFMLPMSMGTQDDKVGYFPYAHSSFEIPETKLRLLGGVAAGSENLFGEQAVSAIAGVEYPFTDHLSFTGEWFSGGHDLSGLIPGLTYHKDRFILVAGYKIPNNFEMRDSGFVLEAGFFFGPGAGKHGEEDGEHSEPPSIYRHYGVRSP